MAEVLLFHHALGLTPGVAGFADEIRAAGHTVHTPDLYAGRTFGDIPSGVAHARGIGFERLIELGHRAADALPSGLVYAGMSLGLMPAQSLAMTRPGARGALLLYGCLPLDEFGGSWPAAAALQIHVMENDAEGDVDIARDVAGAVAGAELFLYPGDVHLFADTGTPDYDERAARLAMSRVLELLERAG